MNTQNLPANNPGEIPPAFSPPPPPQTLKNFLKGLLLVILTPFVFKIIITLVFLVRFWIDSQKVTLPSFLYDLTAATITSVIIYFLAKLLKLGKAKIFSLVIFAVLILALAFLDFYYREPSFPPQNENVSILTVYPSSTPINMESENTPTLHPSIGLPYYKSVIGYSFEKYPEIEVNELRCNIEEFKEPNYGKKRSTPKAGDYVSEIRTIISDGNWADNLGWIRVVEYGKTIKTIPDEEIEKIHQGKYTCLKFFGDFQPIIDEAIRLNKLDKLQPLVNFERSPIAQSFNLTSYSNAKSGLFGVIFYNIGGYAVPDLRKSKYYYLLSKDKKYFVQISYNIPDSNCNKLINIEKGAGNNDKFNENDYITAIKEVLPACDKVPPSIKLFLDTFHTE